MKTRMPRLLWANTFCLLDTSSGASISVRQMLMQLANRGWDIFILGASIFDSERGISRIGDQWETVREQKGEIVRIVDGVLTHHILVTENTKASEMTIPDANKYIGAYTKLLDDYKPDLVWLYGGGIVEYMIAHEAQFRQIPVAKYLVNPSYTKYDRWARDIDLIITDSQATAEFYQEHGHKPWPVGKFIDASQFVAEVKTRERVLFINPSLSKGVAIVVVLAMILEKQRPDITFEVVESRGTWDEMLRTTAAVLGLQIDKLSNVVVTPNTDNMKEIYSRARIVLVPSLWWESGARVIAEAMLNGIPVIATHHGGNAEMMGDGGVTFNLPAKMHEPPYAEVPHPEGLQPVADLIARLFDDETLYQDLSRKAWLVGQQKHNIETNTDRLIEAFEHVITNYKPKVEYLQPPAKSAPKNSLAIALAPTEKGLFIDCGGYDGCSAVKFMLQNPQFDSITFEPNPALWPHYADVPTTLIKKAAYTHGGMVTFTIDETDADGSSLVESKKIDWHGKVTNEECPKIEVGCVDIAELVSVAAKQYQKIVLKLDIEGAEYDVLEKLLQEDLVKHLTIIYAEFHWHKCGFPESRHNQLVAALKQQTQVAEWDALDYAVYRRSDELKQQRAGLIKQRLGNVARYQNTRIGSLMPEAEY